jgi:hypothetical protein
MAIIEKIKGQFIESKDLVIESFDLIRKDKSLLIPAIITFFLFIVIMSMFLIILAPIISGTIQENSPQGTMIFIGILFIIAAILFLSFLSLFLNAALTWMAYEAKQGKDTTFFSGLGRAFKEFFDIILLFFATIIVNMIVGKLRSTKAPGTEVLASTAEVGWKLLINLIMPAMILTEHHFFSAWTEIKEYKEKIAQVIVGGFGLGLLFGIITGLAWLITLGAFFGLIFISGSFFAAFVTAGILFTLLIAPLLIFSSTIKIIYFTLLYMKIKSL